MKRFYCLGLIVSLVFLIIVYPARVSASAGNSLSSFISLAPEADPQTGSATFTIPIDTPQGRSGIQPGVQLTYNSSFPNGMLGVGWNLELGAIQRSTKHGVPKYDNTDMFVLKQSGSAQELVNTSGNIFMPSMEGAFMKIEFINQTHWQVTDRKGVKYIFGDTDAARERDPNNTGRVFQWNISRIEDVNGNYMTFEYTRNGDVLYPQYIRYTGNTAQSLPAYATVEFVKEQHSEDKIISYITGYKRTIEFRISRIDIYAGLSLQRRYQLIYLNSPNTNRTLLNSVQILASDGQAALPGKTFVYNDDQIPGYNLQVYENNPVTGDNLWNFRWAGGFDQGGSNFGPVPSFPNLGPTYTASSGTHSCSGSWSVSGNGNLSFNGSQDCGYYWWTYLYVSQPTTINTSWIKNGGDVGVYLNDNYTNSVGQTWNLQQGYNLVVLTDYDQSQGLSFNLNEDLVSQVGVMNSSKATLSNIYGDFNGDGYTDKGFFDKPTGVVKVSLSNGSAFLPENEWINNFGANKKVLTGDFNADTLTDIIYFDEDNRRWYVALSDGGQFVYQGQWTANFGNINETPFTGDFNADGLTDIFTYYTQNTNTYARVALNTGNGTFVQNLNQQVWVANNLNSVPFSGDFNADGLMDFGRYDPGTNNLEFLLNDAGTDQNFQMYHTISNFTHIDSLILTDVNSDGLMDAGYYNRTQGQIYYYRNTGSSFSGEEILPAAFSLTNEGTNIQSADFNGDGLSDFLAADPGTGTLEVAYSYQTDAPDIVMEIHNGVGAKTVFDYLPSTQMVNHFLPFPIQVIRTITALTDFGDSYTTTYAYEGGLYDVGKREFRGFEKVRVIDPEGNYSETTFLQDDIYKGRPSTQASYDSLGSLYSKIEYTWDNQNLTPGVEFPYLSRKDNFVYDGNATGRRTAEEFYFEESPQYGDLTKAVQLGEVDLATGLDIGNDSRTVETSYVHSTANWILGLPSLTVVKDGLSAEGRKTWFSYDGLANGAVPIKGMLTKKEDWAGGGAAVNPVIQYAYDVYGNLINTTDPRNNVTTIAYDSIYHLFPVTTTNALNHSVANEYYGVNDSPESGYTGLWGQLKKTTDPNDQQGKRSYDIFGRHVISVSPLDSINFPTFEVNYTFNTDHTKVVRKQRINHGQPETLDVYEFYDGLGRLIHSKVPSKTAGRYVISGLTEYNVKGLPEKQYLPFFSNDPVNNIIFIPPGQPYSTSVYDSMGRVVQVVNPDGTFSSVIYNDWTTETIDENGHKQASDFDAYGRLIQKREYTGADGRSIHYPSLAYSVYATTNYTYDSEGNLVQTLDAHNNAITIAYDKLGRKISMDDPDMGHWSYAYDVNGNLIQQTDALNQNMYFSYDALNRLTNKTDQANLDVDYTYDAALVANSKGRLTQAEYTGNDNTLFEYDVLGREVQSVKMIDGNAYEVNRTYDALSRVLSVEYPDGSKVFYKYNLAGQIEKVANDAALLNGGQ